jgi:DNA mismatch repair protein MutS
LEKPSKLKKVVKRGITEVVTPGLNNNDNLLNSKQNNYLAALVPDKHSETTGLALLDYSTGEFLCYQGSIDQVRHLIANYQPTELLHSKQTELKSYSFPDELYTYGIDDWVFDEDYSKDKILQLLEVSSLQGFGIDRLPNGIIACGVILHYLENTENKMIAHIDKISRISSNAFLWLDPFTIRNLELLNPLFHEGKSLLDVVDQTMTPMGARKLRKDMIFPLIEKDQIEKRFDLVAFFLKQTALREQLRETMRHLGDLERLVSRVSSGKFSPRHVVQLKKSLEIFASIRSITRGQKLKDLNHIAGQLNDCKDLSEDISLRFTEEPPIVLGKTDTIKEGFNADLDEFRDLIRNAKTHLIELQQREIKKTGISNLKIGFNNVFGYYLEVTNRYKDSGLVPEDWIRKQTLTNAERYITEELKILEERIRSAQDSILELEEKFFQEFLLLALSYIPVLKTNAQIIAKLDVLLSHAEIAEMNQYCRPVLNEEGSLLIEQSRHPVIEAMMPPGESFIPNNINLDRNTQQILVITGPNMSGKSAVLRQTALCCLMAQTGSFIPAKSANLPLLDRIFTRVGASDNISSGESTFMVEMNETANILNNLSNRSLLLLDEIGRGTSTFDGISIAWSIVEYLHNLDDLRPFTLFATHYHELNELANKYDRVKNFHVSTRQVGNKVLFLRKLEPGSVEHSFGIYVAKMAGMPKEVLKRASEVLQLLESHNLNEQIKGEDKAKLLRDIAPPDNMQLSLFQIEDPQMQEVKKVIDSLDLNIMTPLECMLKLKEIINLLKD